MRNFKILYRIFSINIILVLLLNTNAPAQDFLSKEEILKFWSDSVIENRDCIYEVYTNLKNRFDMNTNCKFSIILNSLKDNGVDTFCIFNKTSSGGLSKDTCAFGVVNTNYIFWKKNGTCFVKKFINHCAFDLFNINICELFDYFQNNYNIIKDEFFMPIIFSAYYDSITYKFKFKTGGRSDDIDNFIFIQVGSKAAHFKFSDSYISDSRSQFYNYNAELKSYALYKTIENFIDTFDDN